MLVRAARQKTRPVAIRNRLSCEQLYLPWLCPACIFPRSHRGGQRRDITAEARSQALGQRQRQRRTSNDGLTTAPRRSLATAALYETMPFVTGPPPSMLSPEFGEPTSLTSIRPHTYLKSPTNLGGSVDPPPVRYKTNNSGVGGHLEEMIAIYGACLTVGNLYRARIILTRLLKIEDLGPEGVLSLHNQYLESAVHQLQQNPSRSATDHLHKWFELEIRNAGLPLDAETLRYMLKASLQFSRHDRDRQARLIRRYMDIGDSNDLRLEILDLNMWTAEELNQIINICPEYNFGAHSAEPTVRSEHIIDSNLVDEEPNDMPRPRTVPLVRPVEQKGLGLTALKESLEIFMKDEDSNDSVTLTHGKRETQIQLETDAVKSAVKRWKEESINLAKMGMNTALQTKSIGARMWRWKVALEQALKEEIAKVDEAELKEKKLGVDVDRCFYGPFLRLLPPDQLAAVTILSCMNALSANGADRGMSLSNVIMTIAENVEEEALFNLVQQNSRKPAWFRSKRDDKNRMTPALLRQAKRARGPDQEAATENASNNDTLRMIISPETWPPAVRARVGACLMSALVESAKLPVTLKHQETGEIVTQMQPAFSHSYQVLRGKKLGVILANAVLVKQLKREPVHCLLAKHLPMLVQPDPWTDFNKGGFIAHPAKVMRIKLGDKDQRHYAEAAINKGDMEQTFKGLDVLGKTSWRINQPLLDVMLEAWNSGEAIANLAPEFPNLPVPPEPATNLDPLERRTWIQVVRRIENARSGYHSQRCFQNFQLEIARAMRNEEFYFPHNVDFRGRAYPISPYLNHMGADHCRGLLMFGKGKELGEAGLKWLKIHVANVFGFDKASLKEREDFTTKHLPKIYDCVNDPLGGTRWWLNAEDPWQFLAACMELKRALDSPDPTRFVSHLPIHQDGTCNGLQHYAALGGDSWGAKQVNLEPGDRPADVYTAVADLVKGGIAADKEKGVLFAEILDGKINRKIVKQTVMTNVYGVTFVGAKAQVRKALVSAHKDLPNDIDRHPGILASYIATKIFSALATMFRGAHDIQYWLGECAIRISQCITPEQMDRMEEDPFQEKSLDNAVKGKAWCFDNATQFKSSVIWTTPLHMPVVQPYRTSKARVIATNMQRIHLSEPHRSSPVSKRKQLQAFPPNFIHSLDATHMLLSALQCDELNVTFAAVHDSFWTHAADVEVMNTVLRDTFIRIHSEDVVGRLAAEFNARYKGCFYMAKLQGGTPVLKKIQDLRSAARRPGVSKGGRKVMNNKLSELLTERKRQKLLNSSDPKEVEEGKSMITATSIFEEFSTTNDFARSEKFAGLGEIRVEDVDEDIDMEDEELSSFEKESGPQKKRFQNHGWVWLPLTFPPVPKKGEFDVSRLKESNYFFS